MKYKLWETRFYHIFPNLPEDQHNLMQGEFLFLLKKLFSISLTFPDLPDNQHISCEGSFYTQLKKLFSCSKLSKFFWTPTCKFNLTGAFLTFAERLLLRIWQWNQGESRICLHFVVALIITILFLHNFLLLHFQFIHIINFVRDLSVGLG